MCIPFKDNGFIKSIGKSDDVDTRNYILNPESNFKKINRTWEVTSKKDCTYKSAKTSSFGYLSPS